jgi:hypothetical protein
MRYLIISFFLFLFSCGQSEDPELVDMNDPSVIQPLLSTAVLLEELTTEDELFYFDGAVYTGWAKNRDLSNFCYFKSGKGTIYTKKRGNSLRQQKKKVGKEYLFSCYDYRSGKITNEHYFDENGNMLRGMSWNDNGEIVSTINEGSGVRTLFMLGSPIQQHYRNGVKVRDDLLGVTEKK